MELNLSKRLLIQHILLIQQLFAVKCFYGNDALTELNLSEPLLIQYSTDSAAVICSIISTLIDSLLYYYIILEQLLIQQLF